MGKCHEPNRSTSKKAISSLLFSLYSRVYCTSLAWRKYYCVRHNQEFSCECDARMLQFWPDRQRILNMLLHEPVKRNAVRWPRSIIARPAG
eukprot:6213192-Pleurochrysis_carterae.AAC.1